MDIHATNPRSMPCPHKPAKGLQYRLGEWKKSLLIPGFILILVFTLTPMLLLLGRDSQPSALAPFGETSREEEWANDLIQTADGGFVFVGHAGIRNDRADWENNGYSPTQLELTSKKDIWLVKTDANGIPEWNRTFGGEGEDGAEAVIQTADEGFLIAGYTSSSGAGKSDAWLIKTDANGMPEWNRTFGGEGEDGAEAVIQTADGGFALAGHARSSGASDSDAWLVKTDANGMVEWNRTFGGNLDDSATGLYQLANGSFVMLGYFGQRLEEGKCKENEPHSELFDYAWLLVIDNNGLLLQNFIYERSDHVRFHGPVRSTDNGIIIAGISAIQSRAPGDGSIPAGIIPGDYDTSTWWGSVGQNSLFYLIVDDSGINQWNKTLTRVCGDLTFTADGSFVLFGTGYDADRDTTYQSLVKMDSKGLIQWTTLDFDVGFIIEEDTLIQTADGGYALAGGVSVVFGLTDEGSIDAWLLRADENGTLLWQQSYRKSYRNPADKEPTLPLAASPGLILMTAVPTLLAVIVMRKMNRKS